MFLSTPYPTTLPVGSPHQSANLNIHPPGGYLPFLGWQGGEVSLPLLCDLHAPADLAPPSFLVTFPEEIRIPSQDFIYTLLQLMCDREWAPLIQSPLWSFEDRLWTYHPSRRHLVAVVLMPLPNSDLITPEEYLALTTAIAAWSQDRRYFKLPEPATVDFGIFIDFLLRNCSALVNQSGQQTFLGVLESHYTITSGYVWTRPSANIRGAAPPAGDYLGMGRGPHSPPQRLHRAISASPLSMLHPRKAPPITESLSAVGPLSPGDHALQRMGRLSWPFPEFTDLRACPSPFPSQSEGPLQHVMGYLADSMGSRGSPGGCHDQTPCNSIPVGRLAPGGTRIPTISTVPSR